MQKKKKFSVSLLMALLLALLPLSLTALAVTGFTLGTGYSGVSIYHADAADINSVSLLSGSLPPGLSWQWTEGSQDITVSGTPTAVGNYQIAFNVDRVSAPGSVVQVHLSITEPDGGGGTPATPTEPTPTPAPTPTPTASPTPTPTPTASPSPTPSPSPSPSPTPAPPKITKNPTGETVDVGGRAMFIARADGVESYSWRFVSGDGTKTVEYTSAAAYFPGLAISGGNTDTLTLSSIPQALNGWKAACRFKNKGGEVLSSGALITVNKPAAGSPVITLQPKDAALKLGESVTLSVRAISPDNGTLTYQWFRSSTGTTGSMLAITNATSTSYTPEEKEGDVYYCVGVRNNSGGTLSEFVYSQMVKVSYSPAVTPSPSPTPHVHEYGTEWKHDETSHWHECSCGEKGDLAAHDFEWTETKAAKRSTPGEKKGVCSVCGYETTEVIPATGSSGSSRTALLITLALLAVVVLAVAALLILKVTGKLNITRDDEDGDEPPRRNKKR